MPHSAKNLVFRAVSYVPKGKVLTYRAVAQIAGIKNPRLIGNILHQNTDPKKVPCHRAVNAQGKLASNYAFGGETGQRRILQAEGVKFIRNKVDLNKYLWKPHRLLNLFFQLLRQYGEPGPWPWFGNDSPHSQEEIAIGAILTQNTSWSNVEKALLNLRRARVNSLKSIYQLCIEDQQKLKELIRPAGFYNQKAQYLLEFAKFTNLIFKNLQNFFKLPLVEARSKLLAVRGVGPETADTILLYAGGKPIFVIDAYTKRFIEHHQFKKSNFTYQSLQNFFTNRLPQDVRLYQDYHALTVKWGKERS